MAPEPSVRGSLLQPLQGEVHALIESGRLSRDGVEARLDAADIEILDTKSEPERWYPIASYEHIAAIADDGLARRRRRDWIEEGRRRFWQLEDRPDSIAIAEGALDPAPWSALYSFMTWSVEAHPGGASCELRVRDASALPERERFRLQGWIEAHVGAATRGPATVTSERFDPDVIVFWVRAPRLGETTEA